MVVPDRFAEYMDTSGSVSIDKFIGSRAPLGTAQLGDGTVVGFRLGTPGDRQLLLDAFDRLSPRSRYFRFFTSMPKLPAGVVDRLIDVAATERVAVVVFELDKPDSLIGVVRYFRQPGSDEADVALTVLDDWQGQGVAGLAFDKCVEAALAEGIVTFTASTLSENGPMVRFFRRRGATTSRDPEDLGVINVRMALADVTAKPPVAAYVGSASCSGAGGKPELSEVGRE